MSMLSVDEWRPFLQTWSAEWLSTDEHFPEAVRQGGWLGFDPASPTRVARAERRLGFALPPTYRAFLLTTNGWRKTSPLIKRLRSVEKVKWLEVEDPQMLDIWCEIEDNSYGHMAEEYFAYDGRPIFDTRHLKWCLTIADPVPGDSMVYLLCPAVVTEDGEWEAWRFANWIPGAERFPSFAHLMRNEYESFRQLRLDRRSREMTVGPYAGVYAPDAPRHAAPRIGPGKLRVRRRTVWELIQLLENASERTRLDAAKQLFHEYKPHQPENERPEWVGRLARILRSDLESEVRQAAACMLGSYGDSSAIDPLVEALRDRKVSDSALGALFYLSIDIHDPRIADAMSSLLEAPRSCQRVVELALSTLQAYKDPRLASIGLKLLDTASEFGQRQAGAHAVIVATSDAVDLFIARLKNKDPGIRAAAAWGLGATEKRRAIKPLRAALGDPDPEVRRLAAISLERIGV
jgi:HEAT repeat protein